MRISSGILGSGNLTMSLTLSISNKLSVMLLLSTFLIILCLGYSASMLPSMLSGLYFFKKSLRQTAQFLINRLRLALSDSLLQLLSGMLTRERLTLYSMVCMPFLTICEANISWLRPIIAIYNGSKALTLPSLLDGELFSRVFLSLYGISLVSLTMWLTTSPVWASSSRLLILRLRLMRPSMGWRGLGCYQ